MSEDSPLSNQNQAVRDTAKEIARRILTYVANKENGISDLMKEIGKAGFVVEVLVVLKPNAIQKFVPAEKPKFNAREVAPERPGRAELQTASDMGISLDDVESVEAQV